MTGQLLDQRRMQTKLQSPALLISNREADSNHSDSGDHDPAVSDYEWGFDHDLKTPTFLTVRAVMWPCSKSLFPLVSPISVLSLGTVPPARTESAMGT